MDTNQPLLPPEELLRREPAADESPNQPLLPTLVDRFARDLAPLALAAVVAAAAAPNQPEPLTVGLPDHEPGRCLALLNIPPPSRAASASDLL